jgi:hypothetical protein
MLPFTGWKILVTTEKNGEVATSWFTSTQDACINDIKSGMACRLVKYGVRVLSFEEVHYFENGVEVEFEKGVEIGTDLGWSWLV